MVASGRRDAPTEMSWDEGTMSDNKMSSLRDAALHFHEYPKPGKIEITPTKPLANRATWRSPIRRASPRPARISLPTRPRPTTYTSKGNLVAVISNGTRCSASATSGRWPASR